MLQKLTKLLGLLFCVALLWVVSAQFEVPAVAATVDSGTCGDNLTWALDDQGLLTLSGSGAMANYKYSSSVPWYQYRQNIKTVIISEGVTSIGYYAFYDCSSLQSITIPESVTSIGSWAFADCSSLQSITIPEGVTSIGYYAFRYCTSLQSITIPEGVTSIGGSAFDGCTSLQSITIPESVTSIGSIAFQSCTSLQSITIPESVTSIGDYAFSGCSSLQSITIPESVTSIGDYAFGGCDSLSYRVYDQGKYLGNDVNPYVLLIGCVNPNITGCIIHPDTRIIGSSAFSSCSSLQSITIPESVTSIGGSAFQSCTSLQIITIPEGVTSIGYDAFYGCSSLQSITIPEGVTSIGAHAFYGCSSLQSITIPEGVTSIGSSAFKGCTSLQSITIPESVTSIGGYAFKGCTSLQSITIPEGVTSIGYDAFYGCSSLQSITIPEGVTSIYGYAFYGCSSLQSITIPESVTSIGWYAFYDCSSLQSITIPEGVTSIGYYAFKGCTSLQSITIPESVTSIDDYAFYNCRSLKIIQFMGLAPTYIGQYSFQYVTADVYTLCTDASWTGDVKSKLDGNLTWKGHLYVIDCVYNEDATCTKNGTQTGLCKGCGKKGTMVAYGTAGHQFSDYVDNGDTTCTQDGTQTRSCSACGQKETVTIPDSATGHLFGSDGVCTRCGTTHKIFINLTDSYGDGWSGSAIEVYGDGALLTTATISSGSSKQVTLAYDPSVTYTFQWSEGSYSNECGFEILLDEELLISGMGDEYYDGDTIYTLAASNGGVTLSGSITDFGDGDATLTLTPVEGEAIVINASGSYSITAAPGEYILTVSMANHVTRQYAVTLGSESITLDVKIHLIGDIDGNGKVNVGDVAKLNGHIKGTAPITDEYQLLCANINGGKLNMGDTAALYSHIRGTKKLY